MRPHGVRGTTIRRLDMQSPAQPANLFPGQRIRLANDWGDWGGTYLVSWNPGQRECKISEGDHEGEGHEHDVCRAVLDNENHEDIVKDIEKHCGICAGMVEGNEERKSGRCVGGQPGSGASRSGILSAQKCIRPRHPGQKVAQWHQVATRKRDRDWGGTRQGLGRNEAGIGEDK
jgi:hypothetical protein